MDNKRILIVEDERNLARTLAQALRLGSDGNFEVQVCETAEESLELLKEHSYSLVISDLRLPGMDGLQLIAKIKNTYPETHTILITGFGSEDVEARADELSEGYLTKPFDMLDMLMMVQKVISPKKRGTNGALRKDDLADSKGPSRILIMEDDAGLRRIYSKALKKSYFEVHEAPTVQVARQLLESHEYDIFICDIHMGRERGTDLLTEYGDHLDQAGTQVVMCSAYGQYRTLTEEMGADFFLEKPISLGTLLTLVNRVINAKDVSEADDLPQPPNNLERTF